MVEGVMPWAAHQSLNRLVVLLLAATPIFMEGMAWTSPYS